MQKIKKVLMGVVALGALAFGGAQIAGAAGGSSSSSDNDGPDAALTGTTASQAKAAAVKAVGGGTATEAKTENEGDAVYEVKVDNAGKTYEVQLDKSFGVVAKGLDDQGDQGDGDGNGAEADGDGGDQAVTGTQATQAKTAAVKAVGGGTAQDVRGENDGDAVYEVEVTKGGKTYEVQLDKSFSVVKQQLDTGDGDGETSD
jgi:uncharacterized membrane protein YkoI